jgi:regulator of replication initiation timing
MPPKAKPAENQETSLDELVATVRSLTSVTSALKEQLSASSTTISDLSRRLTSIEALLKTTQKENADLKAENSDLKADISCSYQETKALKTKLNNLEQHHRSWSIRVVGMKIPTSEESDNEAVKRHLYSKLLKPILAGAVQKGLLSEIPSAEEVLERAHILPTKKDGAKPIIARFYCREIRALIFKLKKEFAPKEDNAATMTTRRQGSDQRPRARFLYQVFDDLTRANFSKMRAISDDSRVDQCWAVNGQLRFKLVNSQEVKKVTSIYDSIEEILQS